MNGIIIRKIIYTTGINPEASLMVGDHHDHPLCWGGGGGGGGGGVQVLKR